MTTDFWSEALNAPVEPPPEREDLPAGKWTISRTCAAADGGWAPTVYTQDKRDGSGSFFKFKIGLTCLGGEPGITKAHTGRRFGFDSFVEPGQYDSGNPLAGKLMGFLNAVFSPGVAGDVKDSKERATQRWRSTLSVLKEAAESQSLDPTAYPNPAVFLATCAKFALEADGHVVLVKTNGRSYERDGEKRLQIEAGQVEDYTVANAAKRRVTAAEGEDVPAPAAASGF